VPIAHFNSKKNICLGEFSVVANFGPAKGMPYVDEYAERRIVDVGSGDTVLYSDTEKDGSQKDAATSTLEGVSPGDFEAQAAVLMSGIFMDKGGTPRYEADRRREREE
jgi:hypothetical protein